MDFQRNDNGGFSQRKTYQGDWKCSKCSAAITELPFEPDPNRLGQLLCRDCHRERRQSFRRR
jgi:CxxC-x17-CxxC domain-containing protein